MRLVARNLEYSSRPALNSQFVSFIRAGRGVKAIWLKHLRANDRTAHFSVRSEASLTQETVVKSRLMFSESC
jgi:hypothetical protein